MNNTTTLPLLVEEVFQAHSIATVARAIITYFIKDNATSFGHTKGLTQPKVHLQPDHTTTPKVLTSLSPNLKLISRFLLKVNGGIG